MKPIVLTIVIASLVFSSCTAAWSYDRYNVGGYWADKAGDKEKALELWKKAVELNEQQKDEGLPLNCDNVAGVLEELKRDEEAVPYRIKASEWWEKFGKLNGAGYSSYMAGVDQYHQKKYEEAEASFQRSHRLYGQVKNTADWQCNALHWVGLCQYARGQYSEAVTSAQSFIELRRKNLKGKTQESLAWDLEFQGNALEALQRYADAEAAYTESLDLHKSKIPNDDFSKRLNASISAVHGRTGTEAKTTLEGTAGTRGTDSHPEPNIFPSNPTLSLPNVQLTMPATSLSQTLSIIPSQSQSLPVASTSQTQPITSQSQTKPVASQPQSQTQPIASQSQPLSTVADSASASDTPLNDKWALVIGISKFSHPEYNLKFAAKDARDFYNYLIKEAHFSPDHVLLLTDERATKDNIMDAFGESFLPAVTESGDLVVVYVSTHGTPARSDKGGRNYIVAHNTDRDHLYRTGVDMDEINRRIKESVKTDRVVIVLDTCFSGAGVPGAKGTGDHANFDAAEMAAGCGHLVVTSSSPNERSWESTETPNGVFTKYFLNALRKNAGKTDLKSAFQEVRTNVGWEVKSAFGQTQTPQLGGDWEGKPLILSLPASKPRKLFNKELLNLMKEGSLVAPSSPAGHPSPADAARKRLQPGVH